VGTMKNARAAMAGPSFGFHPQGHDERGRRARRGLQSLRVPGEHRVRATVRHVGIRRADRLPSFGHIADGRFGCAALDVAAARRERTHQTTPREHSKHRRGSFHDARKTLRHGSAPYCGQVAAPDPNRCRSNSHLDPLAYCNPGQRRKRRPSTGERIRRDAERARRAAGFCLLPCPRDGVSHTIRLGYADVHFGAGALLERPTRLRRAFRRRARDDARNIAVSISRTNRTRFSSCTSGAVTR